MNDKKNHALCYFHAYGKVCLTISAQRIWRAPGLSAHEATPKAVDAHATHMWIVGMALCLPCNRDSGTKRRGRNVAEGRAISCLEEMGALVDGLPAKQLLWKHPVDFSSKTTGQFLMNEDALVRTLIKLRLMEIDSNLGIQTITDMIETRDSRLIKGRDDKLIRSLRKIRKLAAAHDGSAGLYKAYKKVFTTGSL
jgi:hypothetical protein